MTKLSILILTIPTREKLLMDLLARLKPQIDGHPVEILVNKNSTKTIGKKRNTLLNRAAGEWIVFIDDDDMVVHGYVSKILKALEQNPDCVGISGMIISKGRERQWHISKDYKEWYEKDKVYYRSPNHISPIRRSIAISVGFPDINYGEDAAYSKGLLPLLKTEVKIPGVMYVYRYNSRK